MEQTEQIQKTHMENVNNNTGKKTGRRPGKRQEGRYSVTSFAADLTSTHFCAYSWGLCERWFVIFLPSGFQPHYPLKLCCYAYIWIHFVTIPAFAYFFKLNWTSRLLFFLQGWYTKQCKSSDHLSFLHILFQRCRWFHVIRQWSVYWWCLTLEC